MAGVPPIAQLQLLIRVNPQLAVQIFQFYQQSIAPAAPKPEAD
jgi:hypothetical protein